jgi:hypothetical protein
MPPPPHRARCRRRWTAPPATAPARFSPGPPRALTGRNASGGSNPSDAPARLPAPKFEGLGPVGLHQAGDPGCPSQAPDGGARNASAGWKARERRPGGRCRRGRAGNVSGRLNPSDAFLVNCVHRGGPRRSFPITCWVPAISLECPDFRPRHLGDAVDGSKGGAGSGHLYVSVAPRPRGLAKEKAPYPARTRPVFSPASRSCCGVPSMMRMSSG